MIDPSDASALVIRVRLPDDLEALRARHVGDAAAGVPAHITLLYPFARPEAIEGAVEATVATIVGSHAAWPLRLVAQGRWPDTLYATVEPDAPVRALQADLAAAFPSLPLYGGGVPFVPHVTIVEGPGVGDPGAAGDPAWRGLPVAGEAREVELIVRDGDRWGVRRRFALREADG